MADCSVDFMVKQFDPPTISCSASPSTIDAGGSSTINAQGMSPQNRPLTYSYSASAGSVSGSSATTTLTTSPGVSPGPITVTCNVVDDKGQTASTTTTVTVNTPPPPVVVSPKPELTCASPITFDIDHRRPTRVDNTAKACLDDTTLKINRSTDASLYVIGSSSASEHEKAEFAAQRAVNVKESLKADGVDAGRIKVFTNTDDGKKVTVYLVPAGADTTSINATPVDETAVKAIPRTAPAPRKHKKHHKK
jgi:hypothetical protein